MTIISGDEESWYAAIAIYEPHTHTEGELIPVSIESYLDSIDVYDLQERISIFRDLNFKNLSHEGVREEILKVIMSPSGHYVFQPMTRTCPAGTRFFRIRTLEPEDKYFPLKGMSRESDAWHTPPQFAKVGRLNLAGESLLYTSSDLNVAMDEMKIQDGVRFSLIIYEALKDICVTSVVDTIDFGGLTGERKLKHKMIGDFLRHEFMRDVGMGTEYLYRSSEIIAKEFFDLPGQQAWLYPSIARKAGYNTCFRPSEALANLRLVGVWFPKRLPGDPGNPCIETKVVACGFDSNGIFLYHAMGSEVQKRVFPELILREPP